MKFEDWLNRGIAAQRAVDELTKVDAVGTTGGKATVATPKNSMDKIRLKVGPKIYKSGKPGLAGLARLQKRLDGLLVDAARLERTSADPRVVEWCETLLARFREAP